MSPNKLGRHVRRRLRIVRRVVGPAALVPLSVHGAGTGSASVSSATGSVLHGEGRRWLVRLGHVGHVVKFVPSRRAVASVAAAGWGSAASVAVRVVVLVAVQKVHVVSERGDLHGIAHLSGSCGGSVPGKGDIFQG